MKYGEEERLGRTSSCIRCSRDSPRRVFSLRLARINLTCSTWLSRLFFRDCAFFGGMDMVPAESTQVRAKLNTIANTKQVRHNPCNPEAQAANQGWVRRSLKFEVWL